MGSYSTEEHTLHQTLVYCGAPSAGKTCNLQQVQSTLDPGTALQRVSGHEGGVWVEGRPAPISLDLDPAVSISLTVQTVPGEIDQGRSWREVLADADGLVFVVDSQRHRLRDNLIAWADLLENLRAVGRDPYQLPLVVQYNKLDLDVCMDPQDLEAAVNSEGFPAFEASAVEGRGVGKCFSEVVRRMVARAHTDLNLEAAGVARGAMASAVDVVLTQIGSRASRRVAEPIQAVVAPIDENPGVAEAAGDDASSEPGPVAVSDPEVSDDTPGSETPELTQIDSVEPQIVLGPGSDDRTLRERDLLLQLWQEQLEARRDADRRTQDWLHSSRSFTEDATRASRGLQVLLQAVAADEHVDASLAEAAQEGSTLVQSLALLPAHILKQAVVEMSPQADEVALDGPFRAALESVTSVAEQSGVTVDWPSMPRVRGDGLVLQAAFRELLHDAVSTYCADDRTLPVHVWSRGRSCLVALKGPFGVAELGSLPVVRALLAGSGGQVRVRRTKGRASCVLVRLRSADPVPAPEDRSMECVEA